MSGPSRVAAAAAALLAVSLLPAPVSAQDPGTDPGHHTAPDSEAAAHLGHTEFPNSGPPAAQRLFLDGVLWLHSFEYARAAESFRQAQEIAPDFALAYWGEAMTYNHPVWFRQDRDAAREALERLAPTPEARGGMAPTDRERAYLEAVEILFGEGPKARRDTLYAEAMAAMQDRWPEDENAAAFYALALLGTSHGGRDIPTYMRAGAVAEEVFLRNPEHPGALHYLIHSYDDPIHAPLGLRAARRYSAIAGDAPHAQHMTTHIFVAMGMWDGVVRQNEVAAGPDPDRWVAGHYTWWLGYGYLQQGRYREAQALLESLWERTDPEAPWGELAHLIRMRAEYAANTGDWSHHSLDRHIQLPDESMGFGSALITADLYARGRRALGTGNTAAARRQADALAAMVEQAEATGDPNNPTAGVARVMELQLRGLLSRAEADPDAEAGLPLLREARELEASLPFEFGPPLVLVPSGELLGEVLLAEGEPREAMAAFQTALQATPGRAASLLGLARSAARVGEMDRATRAYADLLANWHGADPGIRGLEEARRMGSAPQFPSH